MTFPKEFHQLSFKPGYIDMVNACAKILMSAPYLSHTSNKLIDCSLIIYVSNHLQAWKNSDNSKALF